MGGTKKAFGGQTIYNGKIVERVRLIYEQLEEAKRLIREGSAPKLRLALILLDNAAELLMYRELRKQFAKDDYWRRGSASRPS